MMQQSFPHCCTAKTLTHFPYDNDENEFNIKVFYPMPRKDTIKKRLREIKKAGNGFVTVHLTSNQMKAIKSLVECGFTCVGPAPKTRHSNTELYLLYFNLGELK